MQIAPPSRTDVQSYREIREVLERRAGHINGRFAEFDWMPLRYLNKSFHRDQLTGFFRAARVGFVTPLRDGMNLVAKEYVACQDPEDRSEEHTSGLQSLMRISYAVFCLKTKKNKT